MNHRINKLILSGFALSILAGCITFEPTVDLTQFYILNSQDQARQISRGKAVLVREVFLADYLDNSQVAQREGSNRIIYLAQHRWAGSLDEMIASVIADEINSNQRGIDAAMMQRGDEDLILDVKVLRLDFEPGKQLNLHIEYHVMTGDTRETLRHEHLARQQPLPADVSIAEVISFMETSLRSAVNDMKFE